MTIDLSTMNSFLEQDAGRALLVATASFRSVVKNAKNPHFKSNYADLAECIEAVREPLLQAGLLLTFSSRLIAENGMIAVSASVVRPIGGVQTPVLESEVLLPMKDLTPQGAAALNTYGRRYALLNLFGLAAEDDDGNSAQTETKLAQEQAKQQSEPKPVEVPKSAEKTLASVGFKPEKKLVFK